ncbi:TolC family protein [Phormidium sp. CLA17]|uniref:TolC family protein n=1 Tax=Leptolyngbya sp. Cla-17 TaxID=2803751 RepID=UPI0014920517|nr:TolC family protein [Leptolyngbya sp. Cla-17]MBM0742091.1 TolC family protein [Leptolyngbya sp. Cla-17]
MGSSHPLVAIGVGVLVALSHTAAGYSQEHDLNPVTAANEQSSSEAHSEKVDELPSNQSATQSKRAITVSAKSAKSQPITEKPKPNTLNVQKKATESALSPKNKPANDAKPTNKIAQANPETSAPAAGTTPAPLVPTLPINSTIPVLPFQSIPIGPAKPGMPPDYLNPNPNPLSFPTRPEEVKLRGIQPITLQQALELAKRNNRDLQLANEVLQRVRASLRQAQAARYPTIGANGQISQARSASGQLSQGAQTRAQQAQSTSGQSTSGQSTSGQSTSGQSTSGQLSQGAQTQVQETQSTSGQLSQSVQQQTISNSLRQGSNADQQSTVLNGTVQVGYDIYTSGRRPAQIRAAEQQVRSEELQVEVTLQQLQLDISNAYYNLQDADESVRIQQAAVRNAQASLRDSAALERAGIGTRLDLLRAQVQLANFQQLLVTSLGTQQVRRRELAQLLALPPYLNLAAADPVQIAGVWDMSLEQSIVTAFKNRAELEQQLAQRASAEQQRKAALASLGPTVSFNFQYNILNNLRDQLGFADGFSTALGFQWNFFDGGAAQAQASQQDANIAQAETNFANTRERIQLQVETAYTNLGTNFLNIGTNRQALDQAREALRLARLRFQAGVGTQTEVINTENELTRAEGNVVTAILNYNRALASLNRSVTNLPIPAGSTTPTLPKTVTNSTLPEASPAPLPR